MRAVPGGPASDRGPAVTVTTRYARLQLAKTGTPATTAPGGLVTYHLSIMAALREVEDAPG